MQYYPIPFIDLLHRISSPDGIQHFCILILYCINHTTHEVLLGQAKDMEM
jgi:hypothetical protein